MPRLEIDDDEFGPDLWLGCAVCRAEEAAKLVADAEAALFVTSGEAREEWRELRRQAIELAANSTASATAGAGPRKHTTCSTASEPLQYSAGDDDEQDED